MIFSHLRQIRVLGLFDAVLCPSGRVVDDGRVGLVCERIGSFGDLPPTLSRFASALTKGRELPVLVVGDSGLSSKSVSMARSRAPVDLANVREE